MADGTGGLTEIRASVIIVGAGPTGLMLANFLGQAGIPVLVVERNASTVREPRAVSIDDEALRAMQWLGLEDALIDTLALDYGSHYFDAKGRRFATVEPSECDQGYPKRNAFEQVELERILLEGARRYPTVRILFEAEVVDIDQDGSRVIVTVEQAGATRYYSSTWLVGCDGGRSFVRSALDIKLAGDTYSEKWLIVDVADSRDHFRQTRVVCDVRQPCITLPGPNGIRRYEFMIHKDADEAAIVEDGSVRALLSSVGPDGDVPLRRVRTYTFHARIAERWQAGRILLAGDAAHLSPPFAGQGLNSGLRDAVNLGWKLAAVEERLLHASLLGSYESERKPHVRAIIDLSLRMGDIMMSRQRLRAALTPWFFRALSLWPRARDYVQQMRYRPRPRFEAGFLFPAGGHARAWIGRQFPQPRVERPDRRYALLDRELPPGFVLLAMTDSPETAFARAVPDAIARLAPERVAIVPRQIQARDLEAGLVLRDADGLLARHFDALTGCHLLLRPDRYIAAVLSDDDDDAWIDVARAVAGRFAQSPQRQDAS